MNSGTRAVFTTVATAAPSCRPKPAPYTHDRYATSPVLVDLAAARQPSTRHVPGRGHHTRPGQQDEPDAVVYRAA